MTVGNHSASEKLFPFLKSWPGSDFWAPALHSRPAAFLVSQWTQWSVSPARPGRSNSVCFSLGSTFTQTEPWANQFQFLSLIQLSCGTVTSQWGENKAANKWPHLWAASSHPLSASGNQPSQSGSGEVGEFRGNACGLCTLLTAKGQAGNTIAENILVQSVFLAHLTEYIPFFLHSFQVTVGQMKWPFTPWRKPWKDDP